MGALRRCPRREILRYADPDDDSTRPRKNAHETAVINGVFHHQIHVALAANRELS
jgi:hypothetical protein